MAGAGRRERKVVTVVFADLVGFTSRAESLDPEDVEAILRPYHERLRGELERFGGTVEKFIGDAVMAVFGAPVAHEDDAERAVRAALAIRDWAREEVDVEVRIAVNTGEALVSLDARPELGEAMVAGDVVNTAARLQAAAPVNGVLVGDAAARATRAAIDFRPAEPVAAKGKADPVSVWEAVEPRAHAAIEQVSGVALVGRERELDALAAALENARTRREPQLVTLVGVPGIGKTRLVAELFRRVSAHPDFHGWRRGRSLPYGESTPFAAFGEMVKAQAGILDTDSSASAAAKLHESTLRIAPDEPELEARLRPLVGLEAEVAGAAGDLRAQSFSAWRSWVEALAEHDPLVLTFEDLHWADDALLEFVDYLVDWATGVPLLVIATARPELLERRPGWGGGKRNASTLSLAPLDETDTARLLQALLGRAVLPAETQSALLARAGGNPLYAEQFAAMVSERGETPELPETVQGIIAARLDALPPAEKALLQTAAVVGRQFWLGALVSADEGDRADGEQLLHALQRKEFVRRERRSSVAGETEFLFAHVLVRDVAYGQIPRAERAEKHRATAAWLESLSPDHAESRADLLAYHYRAALELARATGRDTGDLAEAARGALRDAAEQAYALGAFAAAARLYGQALELWPRDHRERSAAVLRHAEALFNAGGRVETTQIEAAAAELAEQGDSARAAMAEIIAAVASWWDGRGDATEAHAVRAVELVRDAPPSAEKAMVLVERSRLLMVASRSAEALEVGELGLAMAQSLGLDHVVASALVTLGTARGMLRGGYVQGKRELEEGIALAVRKNAFQQLQRGYVNLAEVHWRYGHLDDTIEQLREARHSARQFGDPYMVRWLETSELEMAYHVGDWDEAKARADAFVAEVEAGSPYTTESVARNVRAEIWRARADLEAATAEAERALASARSVRDPQNVGVSLAVLAWARLDEGRRAEATALVEELLALASDDGGFGYFPWIVSSAWLACEVGRLDAWRRRAENELPSRYLHVGEAVADGDDRRAAELLEAKGHVTEAAYARLRAGERLAGAGRRAEAEAELRPALAFYRSVGAVAYAQRCEALLAKTA